MQHPYPAHDDKENCKDRQFYKTHQTRNNFIESSVARSTLQPRRLQKHISQVKESTFKRSLVCASPILGNACKICSRQLTENGDSSNLCTSTETGTMD